MLIQLQIIYEAVAITLLIQMYIKMILSIIRSRQI